MNRILLALCLLLSACYVEYDWKAAEQSAKMFAAKMPGTTGEVECARIDSDGDGYCSCTAFMKESEPRQLDCGCPNKAAGKGCSKAQATGCKPFNPLKGINLQGQGQ